MKRRFLILLILVSLLPTLEAQRKSDVLLIKEKYDIPISNEKLILKTGIKRRFIKKTKSELLNQCFDTTKFYGGNCFKVTYFNTDEAYVLKKGYKPDAIRGNIYLLEEDEIETIKTQMKNYKSWKKHNSQIDSTTKIKDSVKRDSVKINIKPRGYYASKKGQFSLHVLSAPYINSFHIVPENESAKTNTGFIGWSVGLDYCYAEKKFLSLSFSQISDCFTPFIFVPIMKEFELLGSDYLVSLSNNYVTKRFSLGYGLSFAQNYWEIVNNNWEHEGTGREPMRKSHNVLGFNFSSYFWASELFVIGIIYRPTFFRLNVAPTLKYEHSISIDFAFKIPLDKE